MAVVAQMMKFPLLLFRGEGFDPNFFYHSGVDIDHSFFLSRPRTLFVPSLNFTLAKKLFSGKVIRYSSISDGLKPFIKKRKIGIDGRSLSASAYKKLSSLASLQDVSEVLLTSRSRKRKDEIGSISRAVRLTKKILSGLDFGSSQFKTENDVRKFLLMQTMELGIEPAYEPIVASGSNSRFPHYQSGNNARLRAGDGIVLIDYGVRYKHYCSDLTRCFFLRRGTKAEQTYKKLQDVFVEIIDAFPGFGSGKDLAEFAEKLYKKYRLPLPPHSIGHGIGLDVHEFPRLSKKYKDPLAGTTMAIEPSAYFETFGVRFEETIYSDGKKARVL